MVVLFFLVLLKHLLDVVLYLASQKLGEPQVQAVATREVVGEPIGVVTLKDLDVLLLPIANVDGDRQ